MPEFKKDIGKLFKSAEEVTEPEVSTIEGSIPPWLSGSFIRVGPAKFDFENSNFTVNHWLDGYAMLSKFDIQNQTVKYQSKFLESDAYKKALRVGKPLITEFGTKAYPDPAKNMFSRFLSSLMPEMSDNDSVSLFELGAELFVTSNTQYFHKINSCSLETGQKFDYHKCFGLNGVSVHPLFDPSTCSTYNLGFSITSGLKYNIIKISSKSSSTKSGAHLSSTISKSQDLIERYQTICTISSRWSSSIGYFHSFGQTKKYIVFIEQPYTISLPKAAKSLVRGDSFKDWLDWRPNEKCKFYLIEKSNGSVCKTEFYSSEAFFFLHFINCFEDGNNQIVVDLITYKSPAVLESMYLNKLRNNIFEHIDPSCSQRFIIPLVQNINEMEQGVNLIQGLENSAKAERHKNCIVLSPEFLSDYELELPVINSRHSGRDYKYFYAVCDGNSSNRNQDQESASCTSQDYSKNSLCKVNVETKKTLLWHQNEFYVPGEPIFLSNHSESNADEDEGVIISTVTDIRDGFDDFLIFLQAKNLQEIGRANFKSHLPQAMHGIFLNNPKPS